MTCNYGRAPARFSSRIFLQEGTYVSRLFLWPVSQLLKQFVQSCLVLVSIKVLAHCLIRLSGLSRQYEVIIRPPPDVEHVRNVMAHAQKSDLVFQRNGRAHSNWRESVQSTTGSRVVRTSSSNGSNAGYTMV